MHFEHLLGRRIVPHLLALFHLSVTCHQSGHIPPPAESRGGWPLSSTPICHSPPAESFGNQAGRLTFTFSELLGPRSPYDVAQRMPLSSAFRFFFGVWSGPMALAGSRPVYVCLQTIYGLNSGVFLSTLLHMPYPNPGVVWRSFQSVFTRLGVFEPPPGFALRRGVQRCPEPMANGLEACEPSHQCGSR